MATNEKHARTPSERMLALRQKQHNREAQIIDAAYAIVQSVFGDDTHNPLSDAGHKAWERPEVQEAAMTAARSFFKQIDKKG